jgi:glycosyltransferase involved in cell wall biosynthesis
MHVAVLLQHYHTPDCATAARPWALVKALAKHHTVTVLTTAAWHERRLSHRFDWVPEGARLEILDVPYANEMSTSERLRSFLEYATKALWAGVQKKTFQDGRPDLVYASSTPLTVGAVGAALALRWRCPWIFEVRDLWPDFPVQMGTLNGRPLLRRALYGLEHFLYRSADRLVTVSPGMVAHIEQFTAPRKVSLVEYGTDFEILSQVGGEERKTLPRLLPNEQVVLYAGSFGRANDLPTLVQVARQLQSRSDVRFVFAGSGYHRPLLERAARRLPGVSLLDPLPYPESLALFKRADLSLVSFLDRPVLATNAPSKFFDSLSAGTPVVVTNPGWTKTFVEEHRCGWYVPAERPAALARRVAAVLDDERARQSAAQNAQVAARAHFDRRVHMEKLLSIIEEVAPRR